jgi:hypothetical protein
MPSNRKLTIEEVQQRHHDFVLGQTWTNANHKYLFHCLAGLNHPDYSQTYGNHYAGQGCPECADLFQPLRAAMGGRAAGRMNKELGRGIFGRTSEQRREDSARAGRIGARKRFELYGNYGINHSLEGSRKGGLSAVASGRLAEMRKRITPESHSRIGLIRACLRWHFGRGIVNPKCSICTERIQQETYELTNRK